MIMIMKQRTSFIERLKIAFNALTKDYYVFVGVDKDAILWNEDSSYHGIDSSKMVMLSYIADEPKIWSETEKEVYTFHDFFWRVIEKTAQKAQEGEF